MFVFDVLTDRDISIGEIVRAPHFSDALARFQCVLVRTYPIFFYGCYFSAHDITPLSPSFPAPVITHQGLRRDRKSVSSLDEFIKA